MKTHVKRAHHLDMVNSMNLGRGGKAIVDGGAVSATQVMDGQQSLGDAQGGMGGDVGVGVTEMEHEGMDLEQVVDLFSS